MFRISAMESLFADHIKPLLQQDRPAAGVEIAPMKVRFEGQSGRRAWTRQV